jgi:PKD repeat protein
LPQIFGERHSQALARYQQHLQTLLDNLEVIENTDEVQELELKIAQTLEHLQLLQPPRQPAVNPQQLPFGISKPITREPFETKEAFEKSLPQASQPEPQKQTPQGRRRDVNPAYLAETDAVQITDEIKALAQTLGYQPVAIFNWVHDNIEFLPSYGSTQSSQTTLDMRRGNAFDTATILLALLRASKIEARYVYGAVQISAERLVKWLKVSDAQMAVNLLANAAIPNGASVAGGEIKAVRLEHVWVEAWVDFRPSRGARHRKGDSWVPLDASFKQHTFSKGLNLLDKVPFDIEGLREHLIETTYTNESGGVMGIDQWYLKTLLTDYQAQLQDYIELHNVQPGDVLDRYSIIPSNSPVLSAGLPYRRLAKLDTFAEIPARYQNSFTIKFYHSSQAQSLDNPAVSYTFNLPTIGSKRLSVTYEPATETDATALENFANSDAQSLPVYLFRVKPVIKLDDTVLATGTPVEMGKPQYYTFATHHPHNINYNYNATATAGDVIVFGVNSNGITKDLVQKRLESVPSDTAAENMHQAGLHFWMYRDWFDDLAAQVYQVRRQRMPSVGAFSLPLTVRYFFGIPRSGVYRSRQVDVKHNIQMVIAKTNEARFNFMTQSGMHGSYLEGSVLDQLFGQQRQPAISASQLLMEASQQNIPIYTITAENVNTILPILKVSSEVKSDVIQAVNSGQQAIVAEREIEHGNWKGSGYILQDLITGSGAYLLEGGLDGGGHEVCFKSVKPMRMQVGFSAAQQQQIAQAFTSFLLTHMSLIEQASQQLAKDDQTQEQLQAAFRLMEAIITGVAAKGVSTPIGCLRIVTNDTAREEIYVAFERDKKTGIYKDVTVDFKGELPDNCHSPIWDFGNGDTTTETNPTRVYTKTGKYAVTLTATCKTRGNALEQVKVDVYASKVEMDIRETANHDNWIAQDDPRTDKTARNKLLVWSDPDNTISFDVVKPDINSVFWVEIFPVAYTTFLNTIQLGKSVKFKKLDDKDNTFNLKEKPLKPLLAREPYISKNLNETLTWNLPLYKPDYVVRFGLDTNQSSSLEKNEVAGEYEIYSITREDHELARSKFEAILGWRNEAYGVWKRLEGRKGDVDKLEYALIYKHAYGIFPLFKRRSGFNPPSFTSQIYSELDYDKITHKCGGQFKLETTTGQKLNASGRLSDKGSLAILDRNYPDGTITLPLYSYSLSKLTDERSKKVAEKIAELLVSQVYFRKKIKAFFCDKNETDKEALKVRQQITYVNSQIKALDIGVSTIVSLPVVYNGSYNAGARNGVGLGTADLNLWRIDLTVKKTNYGFNITGATVWGQVKDIFDYNYFTGIDTTIAHDEANKKACSNKLAIKKHRATASGAAIQCGLGRPGAYEKAGNISSIEIELSNNHFIFENPVRIHAKDGCQNPEPKSPPC